MSTLFQPRGDVTIYHYFSQGVSFAPNVVHEHLIRGQLVLNGQRVVLPLLDFLKFYPISQIPHHLYPEPGPVCIFRSSRSVLDSSPFSIS